MNLHPCHDGSFVNLDGDLNHGGAVKSTLVHVIRKLVKDNKEHSSCKPDIVVIDAIQVV